MRATLIRRPALPAATTEPIDERRTYTVTEVADIVGISRSTAYECVRRGEIPARRFGRRIVVLRHELERLLTTWAPPEPNPPPIAMKRDDSRRNPSS